MGIATQPKDIIISGKIDFICVIFQPSAYQSIFNDPYFNANNNFVSLDSLNDKKLLQLEQQLHETEDNRTCVALIEQFLFHRIYHLARYEDKRINAVMQAISKGEHNIHTLAEIACLSYKQFNRVFANATGTQPKAYLRLTRFQKLKHLLQSQSNANLEQLAEQCGYYDKSHLIKELNAFSNFTPKEFVTSSNSPYSEYHALFRSAFIDIQHNQI